MTVEEELRTAYANLKGHQDRSMQYIKTIDQLTEENRKLKQQLAERGKQ